MWSWIDLDGRGYAGDQANAVAQLIDPDGHRHAPDEPYLGENGIDGGRPCGSG